MTADSANRKGGAYAGRFAMCAVLAAAMMAPAVSGSAAVPGSGQQASQQTPSEVGTALPSAQAGDEKTADIRRLLQLTHMETVLRQFMGQLMQGMKPLMIKGIPRGQVSDEVLNKVIDAMIRNLNARIDYNSFVDETMVPIYDKNFDDQQIKTLVQFYESPVGRRMIDLQPQLMQESAEAGQQWFKSHVTPLIPQAIEDTKAQFPEIQNLQ